MPASARVDRVPNVLTPSTSRFPFVHSQAWSLFPPDACLRLPFLCGRFRDRCATFQAPLAVYRPCGAISLLPPQSPHRSVLGRLFPILAEPRPQGRVPTILRFREAMEPHPATDLVPLLIHFSSICAPELGGFLRRSYGRDTPRSRA